MKEYDPIIPLRRRCSCGKLVKNHHWLCDKCWGKKAKEEYFKKLKKLCRPPRKNKISYRNKYSYDNTYNKFKK